MRLTARTRSFVGLPVLIMACSRGENPNPTPPGSSGKELVIASAPVLVGAGDIAVCGTSGDMATARLVDSVVRADSVAQLPSVVFTLGDNAYPSGPEGLHRDFERCFTTTWGTPRIMNRIRPSPGNHDYDSGSGDPYFDYFGDRAGPRGKGYYSYEVGSWHVMSLNSELYFGYGTDAEVKAQEDWLRDDLQQHRTLCALAYFHRPLFSSGVYGSSGGVRTLWEILFSGGVDLVLNGHEHDYERFFPQTPAGVPDSVHGIEQIISGTGGGNLRRIDYPVARNSAAQIQGRFGVLKLTLGDGQYTHAFIDTTGKVWDPGSRHCH